MNYRPDVDGLRALAVLAVIGFHAYPEWVHGGFVGVDVFFVISGYLISGIIFSALERGRFSFADFYARRIRRIFPALVLVLAACYAAGWFLLFADRFMQLGKHIAGGAGFVSNYVFWNESGYFDAAAETKPLQHLWSLGIEEQFYLAWPLLVYVTWKSRLNLLAVTGLALILSMALNLVEIRRDLVGTFYSPFTRFWELMSGGVLAYLSATHGDSWLARRARAGMARIAGDATMRDACGGLGLIVILATVALLDRSRHFPGLWAGLPVAGASLIILAGPEATLNKRVLSARLVVGLGLISYPLYLWHWPLLSFARLVMGETPSALVRTAAVLVSVALAWVTYRVLESPIRFGPRRAWVAPALCVAMALVGVSGYLTFQRDGLLARPINRTDKAFFVQYYNGIPQEPRLALSPRVRLHGAWSRWRARSHCRVVHPARHGAHVVPVGRLVRAGVVGRHHDAPARRHATGAGRHLALPPERDPDRSRGARAGGARRRTALRSRRSRNSSPMS